MRPRVGVLNNLCAGRHVSRVRSLLDVLRDYPDVLHVETENSHAVPDALSELASKEVDLLVINGGDGTLQRALSEIFSEDHFERIPAIAPLRGGRTNMTALDLGARRDPARSMRDLMRAVEQGELDARTSERSILRVEFGPERETHRGMFFGSGVVARAIERIHTVFPPGRARGVIGGGLTASALIARAAMKDASGILSPDKIEIFADGDPLPGGEYLLVMASTLRRLFLGLRPFWGTGPEPVRLTAISAGARQLPRAIASVARGRPGRHGTPENGFHSRNVSSAALRTSSAFTLDGERFAPRTECTIRIDAREKVRFVRA